MAGEGAREPYLEQGQIHGCPRILNAVMAPILDISFQKLGDQVPQLGSERRPLQSIEQPVRQTCFSPVDLQGVLPQLSFILAHCILSLLYLVHKQYNLHLVHKQYILYLGP